MYSAHCELAGIVGEEFSCRDLQRARFFKCNGCHGIRIPILGNT